MSNEQKDKRENEILVQLNNCLAASGDNAMTVEKLHNLGFTPLQYAEEMDSRALATYLDSLNWGQGLEDRQKYSKELLSKQLKIHNIVNQLKN